MKSDREFEAVLCRKERYDGIPSLPYGQPGYAEYYMAQYRYDGNKRYTCYCLGNPPKTIALTGNLRKTPVGEFADRSTRCKNGFIVYHEPDEVSLRTVGMMLVPVLVAVFFSMLLSLMKLIF